MKLKWIGHSCFLIEGEEPAIRILIDPYRSGAYDGAIGYKPVKEIVDVVLLTHEHPDHNAIENLPSWPLIVRGSAQAKGIAFTSIDLPHDHEQGQKRGRVKGFLFEVDGIQVAHLSDIGGWPNVDQLQMLKSVEVLMIPVGGLYTIDGETAWRLCQEIEPNLVIPMHYKTSKVAMALDPVEPFLQQQSRVRKVPQTTLELKHESLPTAVTTVVLTHAN